MTKTDRRASISRKKFYKRIQHGIGAWSPDFAHLVSKKRRVGKVKK